MYGSGAGTGMVKVIIQEVLPVILQAHHQVHSMLYGADAGTATPGVAGQLIATSTNPATMMGASVFVSSDVCRE